MEFLRLVLPDLVPVDLLPAQHVVVVHHLALFQLLVAFLASCDKALDRAMARFNTAGAEMVEARGEDEGEVIRGRGSKVVETFWTLGRHDPVLPCKYCKICPETKFFQIIA